MRSSCLNGTARFWKASGSIPMYRTAWKQLSADVSRHWMMMGKASSPTSGIPTIGGILTDFTNDTIFGEWVSPSVEAALVSAGANEVLTGLVVDGIIGGVGAVLGFVPQMLILFLMLCALEDCGYMARIAFIMDRLCFRASS